MLIQGRGLEAGGRPPLSIVRPETNRAAGVTIAAERSDRTLAGQGSPSEERGADPAGGARRKRVMDIAIVGGGIGGLTLALALLPRGLAFHV